MLFHCKKNYPSGYLESQIAKSFKFETVYLFKLYDFWRFYCQGELSAKPRNSTISLKNGFYDYTSNISYYLFSKYAKKITNSVENKVNQNITFPERQSPSEQLNQVQIPELRISLEVLELPSPYRTTLTVQVNLCYKIWFAFPIRHLQIFECKRYPKKISRASDANFLIVPGYFTLWV